MTDIDHTSQDKAATYAQMLTAVIAAQRGIADAYVVSGRSRAVGLYLIAHQRMTITFFERMGPAERFRSVHVAFLHWQRSGIQTLTAQLRDGESRSGESSRLYVRAGRDLGRAFEELTTVA